MFKKISFLTIITFILLFPTFIYAYDLNACLAFCDTLKPSDRADCQADCHAENNAPAEKIPSPQEAKVIKSTRRGYILLNIPIGSIYSGNTIDGNLLGAYFEAWYNFLLGTVGIIATIMIMWGGFKWLTSRGDSGMIKDAQDTIWAAIAGMILAFGSYTILTVIKPNLTTIKMPELKKIGDVAWDNGSATKTALSKPINNNGGAAGTSKPGDRNDNNGPKVPCPQTNGSTDYGMGYITSFEGYDSNPYTDEIDTRTQDIYYGHQIKPGDDLSQGAEYFLTNDYAHARQGAANAASNHGVNFESLPRGTQVALTDMSYNMGSNTINNFSNMWTAFATGDTNRASQEVMNSEYGRRLPRRAQMNADIVAAGDNGYDMVQTQGQPNCK